MITIVMSAAIGAKRGLVWRAITSPDEIVLWDERILGCIDAPESYPQAGQHVRWRYRLNGVQLVLHDRPRAVVPGERLQSALSMGSMRFEQTYSLIDDEDGADHTRVGVKVVATNSVPVMGEVVDRFAVRRMVSEHVDVTLRSLQKWCENQP